MPRKKQSNLKSLLETMPWDWPDEAKDWIIAGIDSKDESERQDAVTLSPAIIDDDIAAALLDLLKREAVSEIAGRAAMALGPALLQDEGCGCEEPECEHSEDEEEEPLLSEAMQARVKSTLKALFEDTSRPDTLRRFALEALVHAPEDWHNEAVSKAYEHQDLEWKATALACMGHLDGFNTIILECLNHKETTIRAQALISAGFQDLNEAGPMAMTLAADTKAPIELRIAAIQTLGFLNPSGCEELLDTLVNDPDETIAEAAAMAIEDLVSFFGEEDLVREDGEDLDDDWEGDSDENGDLEDSGKKK